MCYRFVFKFLLTVILVNFCKAELKHVFVTVREAECKPRNYEGGLKIVQGNIDNKLSEKGENAAFNMGRLLAETYAIALNYSTQMENGNYELCSTKDITTRQTVLVLGAGLRNNESEKHKCWTQEELDSVYSNRTEEYMKFCSADQCPAFMKALKGKTSDFANAVKKMKSKSLVAFIKEFGAKTLQSPKKLWLTYLTLEAMRNDENTKLPEWASDKLITDLKKFSKEFFKIACSSDKLKRLAGGRRMSQILTDIVDIIGRNFEFDQTQSNLEDLPRLSVMAAPQILLAAQAAAFTANDTQLAGKSLLLADADSIYPERGAMHVVELHCHNELWFVRVLYKTSADEPFCVVNLKDGEDFCEVYEFVQLLLPHYITEEELEQECKA